MAANSTTASSNNQGPPNFGSGPAVRRTVIRRRVIKGNQKKAVCCNWLSLITFLVTMEAIALVFLMLRSHTILIDTTLQEDAFNFLVWLDTALGGGGEHDREELMELEQWLVQQTEDRLDHGKLLEYENETVALDDYYSRSHFRMETAAKPTVLFVAGVEGSGSQAVTDALVQLNIPLISLHRPPSNKEKDKESYNIAHKAWKEMVNIVLQAGIHSSNYEFSKLHKFSQLRLKQEWEKLYQVYIAKQIPAMAKGDEILYGFQAPDSLFMLPVFHEFMMGPLKVIHLVRDGRDVSLLNRKFNKGNDSPQSMAERFVMESYDLSNHTKISNSSSSSNNLSSEDRSVVEAMFIWNDWNLDTVNWLQDRSNSDTTRLDYLQTRTEDLLSPEKKLEALLQLAHFTGTSKTTPFQKLCCHSRKAMVQESSEYRKSFNKARSQHDFLRKYSAQDLQEDEEEERRRERSGNLIVGKQFRRHWHGSPSDGEDAVNKEIHEHRHNRFQDIGERLAARLADHLTGARRLMESDLEDTEQTKRSTRRIKSSQVKAMFQEYFVWRKSLRKARTDSGLAGAAIKMGEKLLTNFHEHEKHLVGVLTEDSFTRSIKWLKNLHGENGESAPPPPPNHISERYGKWAQLLRSKSELAHRLNSVGRESLEMFGYEPSARYIDFDPENRKSMCHTDVVCS